MNAHVHLDYHLRKDLLLQVGYLKFMCIQDIKFK